MIVGTFWVQGTPLPTRSRYLYRWRIMLLLLHIWLDPIVLCPGVLWTHFVSPRILICFAQHHRNMMSRRCSTCSRKLQHSTPSIQVSRACGQRCALYQNVPTIIFPSNGTQKVLYPWEHLQRCWQDRHMMCLDW